MNRKRKVITTISMIDGAKLYHTRTMKHGKCTLSVYKGQKNKNDILLSSLHPNVLIGTYDKKSPETVAFYNAISCGLDTLD